MAASEGEAAKHAGDWYCPGCKAFLSARRVTFHETCDSCHTSVVWVEAGITQAQIEALPKLLGVCKELLAFAESVRPGGAVLKSDPDFEAARAIIALAEGGAS